MALPATDEYCLANYNILEVFSFSSRDVGCDPMLDLIYKLLSGIVVNSRKTSKTTSVQLNPSVFFFLFSSSPSICFLFLVLVFFPVGKTRK